MLGAKMAQFPIAPGQGVLNLQIERQVEIDGIGMGVLSDGTSFLSGRGLARLCGVANPRVVELGQKWADGAPPPLVAGVKRILAQRGIALHTPYIEIRQPNGAFNAYPDAVCLAFLEYYAFDALNTTEQARSNYRILAGQALQTFIYSQVGYDPNNRVPAAWKHFHDRVSLTYSATPNGYFGIFKEIADIIVTLGQAGAHIDSSFVPDGSVGSIWATHWVSHRFDDQFGERIRWQHNYPEDFPQAKSNPQHAWCYPDAALGEFRRWLRDDYIGGGKFSAYLSGKVRQGQIPATFAQLALNAYTPIE